MSWLRRFFSQPEVLPPPDRSVYRNIELLNRQLSYIFRVTREG